MDLINERLSLEPNPSQGSPLPRSEHGTSSGLREDDSQPGISARKPAGFENRDSDSAAVAPEPWGISSDQEDWRVTT